MSKIVNQGEKGWSKMLKISQLSLWGTPWIEKFHLHIHEFSLEWIYWWYIFCSESDQDFLQNLFCPKNEFWKLEFWQFFNFKVLWKECWWIPGVLSINSYLWEPLIAQISKRRFLTLGHSIFIGYLRVKKVVCTYKSSSRRRL